MLHKWDISPREAVQLQKSLRAQVNTDLELKEVNRLAGVDVAYLRGSGTSVAVASILSYPDLELMEVASSNVPTPFPYVPGLLSFREIPPILEAFRQLSEIPDIIFVDGHGQAHPRRMGIASHLGLWLEKVTIGVGKSRLCGKYEAPGYPKGSCTDLLDKGELIGKVLRTRDGVNPIFVSVGYGLPLEECVSWTLRVTPRFRIPEPIRQADRICAEKKQQLHL